MDDKQQRMIQSLIQASTDSGLGRRFAFQQDNKSEHTAGATAKTRKNHFNKRMRGILRTLIVKHF